MQPTVMQFGHVEIISPDGTDAIPPDLWPELRLLVILQPEPSEALAWRHRLETFLGVTDVHRAYVEGGEESARDHIRKGNLAKGLVFDEFSKIDPSTPFPGEGPQPIGHALAGVDEDDARGRRKIDVRPGDAQLAWYIARAATRLEHRAEKNLIELGYAVYTPRLARWRRTSRIRARVEQPLFGGYMFVGIGAGQTIAEVVECDGVHNLIRIDGVPRRVAFAPIAALAQQEVDGEFDRTRRDKRRDPEPGTAIDITGGMFKGWPARFVERRDDERIALMLEMFGKLTPYSLDPEDVALPELKAP